MYFGFLYNFTSPNTRKAYAKDLKKYLYFLHTFFPGLDELRAEHAHVVAYKNYLLQGSTETESHVRERGEGLTHLSHRTINRHLACVWSFYQYLFDQGLVSDNPARLIKRFRISHEGKTMDLADHQVLDLLAAVDRSTPAGLLHYALLMVLFTTGMRHHELTHMRLRNLTYENTFLVFKYKAKGDKEMVVPVHPKAEAAIGEYLAWCKEQGYSLKDDDYIFRPTKNPRSKGRGLSALNKALDTKALAYIIKKYAQKIGIQGKITPHSARATVIGHLLAKGISIDRVADFVGHKNISTTKSYNRRQAKLENNLSFALDYAESRD
ncbi:MAG: tyrosine-type recombinase/integrase [Bacteriovoracaceae bacterium]|nr:tyrosine-type recombinase/integrase [Bacteriovoracaceae bacterium]